jgi:hypothetical protein
METNTNPLKEIFDELFGLLESLETQSMAVTQFLKDQNVGNDKKLAPYLEQAGNASSVKWRAARARMEYLLTPVQKEADDKKKAAEKKEPESKGPEDKAKVTGQQPTERQQSDKSGTKGEDQADNSTADANIKPAKNADSNPARPETKEKSKPEPERQ